ncbi:MAG: hypothetical protein KDD28_22605 [Phaeodactylibacter sp.]|mgnify:CR=1 FL=1|nr:hypothetical protein [Phaeodactylibacter sp.]
MIDFNKVSDKLKGNTFQYAQFISMTDFAAGTPSERYSIETQIIGIDRQIEQINAPRW